jgi:branched-subunit amino acid transport protein
MTVFIAVAIAGAGTYVIRASMLLLLGGNRVPKRVEQSLVAVAPAVVGVIVAGAFTHGGQFGDMQLSHTIAAVVAFAVVRSTRNLTHGALAGMVIIWASALGGIS